MKILKYLFFLLLILFIAGSIYFATKEGSYQIEETQMIAAPRSVVFEKVSDYTGWGDWAPWKQLDPTTVFDYQEKTEGEGAGVSWRGEETKGQLKTDSVVIGEFINQVFTFDIPTGERTAAMTWEFEEVENGTLVTAKIQGEHNLTDKAWLALSGYDFEAEMRQLLVLGLAKLDETVREDMAKYTITIEGLTQHSGGYYLYQSTSTSLQAKNKNSSEMLDRVSQYMEANAISKAGKPMTIYNEWNPDSNTAIISSGFPTTSQVIVTSDSPVVSGFIPSQSVIKTVLKGDYKYLMQAWEQSRNYVQENGFERSQDSAPFEIYITGPDSEPNPAKWITELYLPVITADNPENQESQEL